MKKSGLWALAGSLFWVIGDSLNQIAMFINGGDMPVRVSPCDDSQWIGHQCMHAATHLKIICDIFPLGGGVVSFGDFCIMAGSLIFFPAICFYLYSLGSRIEKRLSTDNHL